LPGQHAFNKALAALLEVRANGEKDNPDARQREYDAVGTANEKGEILFGFGVTQ
jgi:hypothetical protein